MSSEEVAQQPGSSPGGPVSREEMYAEVWRRPMTKIADHHRVSSSFLARVCARMNVPRPPRGHWVKLENGIPSPQPPLPEAGPGDLQVWRRGMLLVLFLNRLRRHRCRVKSGLNSSGYHDQGGTLLLWGRMKSLSKAASSTRASSSPGGSVWWMSW